ncbi:60S acidic ribosomal protein P2 [Capsicum annuum]|uniref:60S acidic ribosomal protein P2 n=1 Tax=Capsicum annuum TaxID=4072 RepID=A0A2G2Z9P7_CAPAN|nr:60S acidic ribosomal protein P2 [Capsicum annuum]PHT78605.1 60S acidic ribosomal protein P2 [Capsicum annuum]
MLAAVGAEGEDDRIQLVLSEVKGKDITELIASSKEKLASVPFGGVGNPAIASISKVEFLDVLSQIEGIDLDLYKHTVFLRVLEKVINCKDEIAQGYLMDCIKVFPDEYHSGISCMEIASPESLVQHQVVTDLRSSELSSTQMQLVDTGQECFSPGFLLSVKSWPAEIKARYVDMDTLETCLLKVTVTANLGMLLTPVARYIYSFRLAGILLILSYFHSRKSEGLDTNLTVITFQIFMARFISGLLIGIDDFFCAVGAAKIHVSRSAFLVSTRLIFSVGIGEQIGDKILFCFRLSALKWHPDKHQSPSQFSKEIGRPCTLLRNSGSQSHSCIDRNGSSGMCRDVGARLNFVNGTQFLSSVESIVDLKSRLKSSADVQHLSSFATVIVIKISIVPINSSIQDMVSQT